MPVPTPPSIPALAPTLAGSQRPLALRLLMDPTASLQAVADALGWTLDQLTLYLTSDEGLELIAQCELATALRTRLVATAQLHTAIKALGIMLSEYAHAPRTAPTNDPTPNSSANINPKSDANTPTLRETQHSNARRAAHLLFRLAHFTPKPIRSYAPTSPPNFTSSGGGTPGPTLHSNAVTEGTTSSSTSSSSRALEASLAAAHATATTASQHGASAQRTLDNRARSAPTSQPHTPHAEGVEVNSRGSPRSGTPGKGAQFVSHREAVQVPTSPHEPHRALTAPTSQPLTHHAEGVAVSSRGLSERVRERTQPPEHRAQRPDPEGVVVTPPAPYAHARSTHVESTKQAPNHTHLRPLPIAHSPLPSSPMPDAQCLMPTASTAPP